MDRHLALRWKEQTEKVAITATPNFKSNFRESLTIYCNIPWCYYSLQLSDLPSIRTPFDNKNKCPKLSIHHEKKNPPNTQKTYRSDPLWLMLQNYSRRCKVYPAIKFGQSVDRGCLSRSRYVFDWWGRWRGRAPSAWRLMFSLKRNGTVCKSPAPRMPD